MFPEKTVSVLRVTARGPRPARHQAEPQTHRLPRGQGHRGHGHGAWPMSRWVQVTQSRRVVTPIPQTAREVARLGPCWGPATTRLIPGGPGLATQHRRTWQGLDPFGTRQSGRSSIPSLCATVPGLAPTVGED